MPSARAVAPSQSAVEDQGNNKTAQHVQALRDILMRRDLSCSRLLRSWLVVGFACAVCAAIAFGIVQIILLENEYITSRRAEARRAATPYAESMRAQVVKSVSAAYSVASLLRVNTQLQQGVWDEFESVALLLRRTYGGISNLQLAPCGVVEKIVPLAGNEGAIGHKLLEDPDRVIAALDTIRSERLTFVGPLNLVQGGVAIIGRYPVFLPNGSSVSNCSFPVAGVPPTFWGYSTMLTTIDDLFAGLQLQQLPHAGYQYAVTAPGYGVVVSSTGGVVPAEAEHVVINFEDGQQYGFASWTLSVAPTEGWYALSPTLPWKLGSLVLVFIGSLVTGYTLLLRNLVLAHALQYLDGEMTKTQE